MATKKTSATAEKADLIVIDPNQYAVGDVIDYGDDAGAGVDDITMEETGVPFLKIIQDDCQEIKKGIVPEDALGKLFNTGSQELVDEMLLVPAIRQHVFAEWVPRKKGGGIVGVHQPGDDIVIAAKDASEEFGKYKTETGNDLAETYYLYCIELDPKTQEPVGFIVVPFASSSIKVYKKRLMGRLRPVMVPTPNGGKKRPPMFAHRIVISTEIERKGDDEWFQFVPRFAVDNNPRKSLMTPEHPAYQAGAELASMVGSGDVKADLSKAENTTSATGEDGGSAF